MPVTWKIVRVFISSTFRDMQAERDWLVKRVFPALRQRLEPHRIHLVDIDLRWGITRQQADNDQVLGLCLQQIDECRPFFVGLLGGRYGWVPSKFPVEVGKRFGWTQHHTGKSVTELEILHGVLNDPAMHGRALFCFRSDRFLDAIADEQQRRVYVEGPTDEELRELGLEEAERRAAKRADQLQELTQRIKKLSPPMPLLDGYPCQWNPNLLDPVSKTPGRVDALKALGDWVIEKLEHAILNAPELQEHIAGVRTEIRDDLAEERGFHDQFIENRTRVYVGRQRLQDELKTFVAGTEAKPCFVTGPSGSGKSAALAKFVSVWRTQHQQEVVIVHFVGASPRSTNLREMLRHLCAELKDALKLEDEIKHDVRELSEQFREFLAKMPADRRVVLVLDALSQLDETDNAHALDWLPTEIPPQVRLVVSCIDDPDRPDQPALAAMRRHAPHEIKVGLLTNEERLGIVLEIPSVAAKTLDEAQVRLLLDNEATRNPLFLLVALEELRGFGSFEELNRRIAGLPQAGDTLTAIFQQVIRRLGGDFDAVTVKDVLTLLACSRHGLSERELLDLFEGGQVRIEDSAGDLFPILRQLRPYLQSRGPLLDFYHRHLAKATREEFFSCEGTVQCHTHQRLAAYFSGCAKGNDATHEWETDSVRGFAECNFHLIKSRHHDRAVGLLTHFPFLLNKLRAGLLEGLFEDYDAFRQEAPPEAVKRLETWIGFFREKARILRRGKEEWPAYKILLQLAVEHGDDSPLTMGAEKWLVEGRCNWLWLRRLLRLAHAEQNRFVTVLEGHTGLVDGALALSDGRLLSWSGGILLTDKTLRLWDAQGGACLRALAGHTDSVDGALALPDGRLLSWSWDHTLRLWDAQNGSCVQVLAGHDAWVTGALAMSNGRLLSWSVDKTLRLWDAQSGACMQVFAGHYGSVEGALVLSDRRLLSWSDDKTLRLWDAQSGACVHVFAGHTDGVNGVLILPDRRLLSWSKDETLRLWDAQSGACMQVFAGHYGSVEGALVLSDRRLLSWSKDKTLRLWDAQSGACVHVLAGHTDGVNGAQILSDGRLLSWSKDKTLRLWDAQSKACVLVLAGHDAWVEGALALSDGRLLSWSHEKTLRVWDAQSGDCLQVLTGHTMPVMGALILPDMRVLSWGWDKTLRLWEVQGEARVQVLEGHNSWADGPMVLSDGRLLSWSEDKTLRLWEARGGACVRVLTGHTGGLNGALVLSDRQLLSWSDDRTLRLWDAQSGACVQVLTGHTGSVKGALVLSDGPLLSWSGGDESTDHSLRLWDAQSGACLQVLAGHTGEIRHALALTEGRLVSWSADKTLRLWEAQSGACVHVLSGHTEGVNGALVLSDRRLLSWSDDKTLQLWDAQSGACLHVLAGHTDRVKGALVLSDGHLLSWSNDKTLRLWDAQSGACVQVFAGHTGSVEGALVLSDRRLLSWPSADIAVLITLGLSEPDSMWRMWDRQSGACLEKVPENQVANCHPEWLHARLKSQSAGGLCDDWFGDLSSYSVHLRHKSVPVVLASWNADSETRSCVLLLDGTLVVTQENGQVCILKLYQAHRRISLAEAEALLAPRIQEFLGRVRLREEAERERLIQDAIKTANQHFLKGYWEVAAMEFERLLACDKPLIEYTSKLITCLLNAHEDLLAGDTAKIETLLGQLESAGHAALAAPLRQQFEAKRGATKKPWWKVW